MIEAIGVVSFEGRMMNQPSDNNILYGDNLHNQPIAHTRCEHYGKTNNWCKRPPTHFRVQYGDSQYICM